MDKERAKNLDLILKELKDSHTGNFIYSKDIGDKIGVDGNYVKDEFITLSDRNFIIIDPYLHSAYINKLGERFLESGGFEKEYNKHILNKWMGWITFVAVIITLIYQVLSYYKSDILKTELKQGSSTLSR